MVCVPSTWRSPAITTVPVLSPTPAGSMVRVAGPEIVSEVTRIAEPSAPVLNWEPVTAPEAVRVVRLTLGSRATETPLEAAVVVTFVPPEIDRDSLSRSISSEPESPVTVSAVPTDAVETLVKRPLASTVITGIAVCEP